MKRSITVCLTLFLSLVMLSVTYAEGIEGDFNDATQSQEVIADTVESVADESDELMLPADDNPVDVNTSEASAPNDRAVSAAVPKSGSCAHSKYSKITGGYKKYSKLDSKKHSVTALVPDDPSVTGVNCYFVKCDSCGEVGFFFDDGWDKRVTWESQGEAFYYEYSVICTEKQYNEAHTFASGKCSKCGYKSSASTTVKLSKTSVTLGEKETYKLTAKVSTASKAKSLRYKSTNTKVATVNAKTGKITAKKAGTSKIQARIGTKTLATCNVTVKKAPETITLNKTKVTLEKGKTFQLKATPNDGTYTYRFTWTSSNKKVAKVSSKGKVTGVGKGTATITVKTAGGKKATCKVTVKSNSKDTTVPIDKAHFPDKTFRLYVKKSFDKNKDGQLSSEEIAAAKKIKCKKTVASMKGIEYFTEATSIYCTGMYELKSLDLRKNTKLEKLELHAYELKSLDLRKNTKLKKLECNIGRGMMNLDISANLQMEDLLIHGDYELRLPELNLSKYAKLKSLDIGYCFVGKLDFSNNTELESLNLLECDGISKLDLKKNTELKSLFLFVCISELDISKCKKLNSLVLQYGGGEQVDISNCPNLVKCVRKGKKRTDIVDYDDVEYVYGKYYVYYTKGTKLHTGPV